MCIISTQYLDTLTPQKILHINGVVFLDIRKAFDSINHKILLRKLKNQFGIHDIELNGLSPT